jgi:hypothetical protein
MARLEDYSFGRVRVDGGEETRDVIVLPSRVVRNWCGVTATHSSSMIE